MTASSTLDDVRLVPIQLVRDAKGALAVMDNARLPFESKRVFAVFDADSFPRGRHAHYACSQLLVCLTGRVSVTCDDGRARRTWELTSAAEGLLIPPGIWGEQDYADGAVLLVLCDRSYEAEDYIRDYQTFLTYKESAS